MTPEQYILLHIYANQKVYMTRILELVAAVKETQETGAEPTGILAASILADAEQLVGSLVDSLKTNKPPFIEFGVLHSITEDQLREWFDKSTDEVFRADKQEDEHD